MPLCPVPSVLCHFSAPVQGNKKGLLYSHSWEVCQVSPHHLFRLPFCLCGPQHLKTFRPDFPVHVMLLSWCKVDGFWPGLASGHGLPLIPMWTARKGSEASVLTTPLQGHAQGCPTWALTPAALTGTLWWARTHVCVLGGRRVTWLTLVPLWTSTFQAWLLVFKLESSKVKTMEEFEWMLNPKGETVETESYSW